MCTQKSRLDNHAVTDTLSTFWSPINQGKERERIKSVCISYCIGSRLGVIEYYKITQKVLPFNRKPVCLSDGGFTDTLSQICYHITQRIKMIPLHGQGHNNYFNSVLSKRRKS